MWGVYVVATQNIAMGGRLYCLACPPCPALPPVCLPSATYCQQDRAEGVAVSVVGDYRSGYLTR